MYYISVITHALHAKHVRTFVVHMEMHKLNNNDLMILYLSNAALGGGECYMAPGQVNPLGLANRPGLLEMPLDQLTRGPITSTPSYNSTSAAEASRIRVRRDTEMIVRAETYTDKEGRRHQVVNMVCIIQQVQL